MIDNLILLTAFLTHLFINVNFGTRVEIITKLIKTNKLPAIKLPVCRYTIHK